MAKKPVNKKLFSEIFGKSEVKRIESVENIDKSKEIMGNYIKSMVALIKKEKSKVKGVKLIEDVYDTKEAFTPSNLILIACENNDPELKVMLQYALEVIILEITFLEDENGRIDKFTSKIDYDVLSDEKKLREKCEQVTAKHFLIVTTVIDKMSKGDRASLIQILDNMAKKFKQADIETRDSNTNELVSRRSIVGDETGVTDFLKSFLK